MLIWKGYEQKLMGGFAFFATILLFTSFLFSSFTNDIISIFFALMVCASSFTECTLLVSATDTIYKVYSGKKDLDCINFSLALFHVEISEYMIFQDLITMSKIIYIRRTNLFTKNFKSYHFE